MEYFAIFLVCTVSGFLTGLLGIGGGLIIVPFFISVLPLFGVHTFSIQQIVAISITCVFINSAITSFYRRSDTYLPKNIMIKLSLGIIIGTVIGSYLASFAPEKVIFAIYVLVCLSSLILMNKDLYYDLRNSKFSFLIYIIFALIGAISSSIGIGGAVFFATALKCFLNNDTKILLPSITMLVLVHSSCAFVSKFILGEVVLMVIPIAIVASLIGSKIGVIVSRKTSAKAINIMMSAVLIFGLLKIGSEFFK